MERPRLSRLGSLAAVVLIALLLTPLAGVDLAGGQSTSAQSESPTITIRTIDSAGDVGRFSSVAIGTDGLALISYVDVTNSALKVAHCNDAECSDPIISTVDSVSEVGEETSIIIGGDGLGLISYIDTNADDDLKVAHCTNANCTSHDEPVTIDTGNIGYYTSLAKGSDGFALIAYHDMSNSALKVAHCRNYPCSQFGVETTDDVDETRLPSIAIGTDQLGLISYYDATNTVLKVAHCGDPACSKINATVSTIDDTAGVGEFSSLAIGPDQKGLISYYDRSNGDLKVAHCDDVECSSATNKYTLDSEGDVGRYSSLAIRADGRGLISYLDYTNTNQDLRLAYCVDAICSSATVYTIDSFGDVGYYTSIAVNPVNDTGLISYYDLTNGDLKLAFLSNTSNPPIPTGTASPTSTSTSPVGTATASPSGTPATTPTGTVVATPTSPAHSPTPTGTAATTPTSTPPDTRLYLPLIIRN